MSNVRADKQIAHERRRAGEVALSDFADYVEKQTRLRKPGGDITHNDEHDELSILETLGLSDDTQPSVGMRDLLLGPQEENGPKLKELIASRIAEGRGETLFDVGLDNTTEEPMGFTKEEYELAMKSVKAAVLELKASITVLITHNLGLDGEEPSDDKGASSMLLIRKQPESLEDLLEIRVAVVGNGKYLIWVLNVE
jgi:hypothetical protein